MNICVNLCSSVAKIMSTPTDTQRMEKIVSLCKRRGFIFQSSEIYGGLNGAWDYGPLGVEIQRVTATTAEDVLAAAADAAGSAPRPRCGPLPPEAAVGSKP